MRSRFILSQNLAQLVCRFGGNLARTLYDVSNSLKGETHADPKS